ncbi:MAG: LysR family transcriptional regulator [Deltaproteobacteria bacterium]|nr:LysR family transcriptional regulator [Deltaproteobacteria bacterium]
MDLEELRALLSVVETGSFMGAERALRVPRATLRRRVDALESRAGVPLLIRTREGVSPTEAGAHLAARGRMLVQEASALVSSLRDLGQEPSGTLRVALPIGLPPHQLVPLFMALRQTWPKLSLRARFSEDPTAGMLEDADLAVHFGESSPPGPWQSCELVRMREWLVAHRDYLARRGVPESLEALHGHELLSWEAPGDDGRVWPLQQGGSFTVEPAAITRDIHLLRQCVLAGHGIGLLPDAMLPDPGHPPGTLIPVLPELVGRERCLRMVVPAVTAEVPRLRLVMQYLRDFVNAP